MTIKEKLHHIWRSGPRPMVARLAGSYRRLTAIALVAAVMVIFAVMAAENGQERNGAENEAGGKLTVKTAVIDLGADAASEIRTVGTVRPETSVKIVALSNGTVRSLLGEVGDEVRPNQTLAVLKNDLLATNYANARTTLANAQNSLLASVRLADESVRQAEQGLVSAEEALNAAAIGLKTAEDNLANAGSLRDKSAADARAAAIVAFYGYLNTADNALAQIDYILDADNTGLQLPGIGGTLGAQDPTSVTRAESLYWTSRSTHRRLAAITPTPDSIGRDSREAVLLLDQTRAAASALITVLDHTVTSLDFPETSLNAQKSAFASLKTNIVNSLSAAQQTSQSLENVGLLDKQEQDALNNAAAAARNRLDQAQAAYNNAVIVLATAREAKNQQLLAAEATVDGARGQLNLVGAQIADLNVKSPITGRITARSVELGSEVSPGQELFVVANTDLVKIEVSLPSEDVYRLRKGQTAVLGDDYAGVISAIDPAADPFTRQVGVEIAYDNRGGELVAGTFIKVALPVESLEKTQPESVFIPLRAVSTSQAGGFVFVARDGRAERVDVVTGSVQGALIEIIDGLENGDELIVEGGRNLTDGAAVEIAN